MRTQLRINTEEAWSRDAVYRPLLSRCDAIIANTVHERRFIGERLSPAVRVLVSVVGIDPHAFSDRDGDEIRTRCRAGSGPVVGYVGRIVPSKGVEELVEAIRVVWRWNHDVRLVRSRTRP